jgi:hypothetical protein
MKEYGFRKKKIIKGLYENPFEDEGNDEEDEDLDEEEE